MKRFFLHLTVSIAVAAMLAGAFAGWRWWRTPAPVVRRLAPPGEYYLVQYVSWRGPNGVIGFPPGTRVKKRGERESVWIVSDGQYETEVRPAQLTDDLDVRDWIVRQDEAAQAALAEFQERERAAWQHARLADAKLQAAGMSAADASFRGSVGGRDTRLNAAAAPAADGRRVAGTTWVYPPLTVIEQRSAGSTADLRVLVVPTPPPRVITPPVPLGSPTPLPARTPAPGVGSTPSATPTPPPKP